MVGCFFFVADIATAVGYIAVSRPFLDLSDPRHMHSTQSEIMLVRGRAFVLVHVIV